MEHRDRGQRPSDRNRVLRRAGPEPGGTGQVGGEVVDRIIALQGTKAELAMLRTPDGDLEIELVKSTRRRPKPASRTRPRTPQASVISPSSSRTSTRSRRPASPRHPSSSASWCATRTATDSATSAAPRESSSSWRKRSADGSGSPPASRPTGYPTRSGSRSERLALKPLGAPSRVSRHKLWSNGVGSRGREQRGRAANRGWKEIGSCRQFSSVLARQAGKGAIFGPGALFSCNQLQCAKPGLREEPTPGTRLSEFRGPAYAGPHC